MSHILLAHNIHSESDILVVEKAIGVLLKEGDDYSKFLASEKYVTPRASALSENPYELSASFKNITVSVLPSKNSIAKECIVTVSWSKTAQISPTNRDLVRDLLSDKYRLAHESDETETWHYTL